MEATFAQVVEMPSVRPRSGLDLWPAGGPVGINEKSDVNVMSMLPRHIRQTNIFLFGGYNETNSLINIDNEASLPRMIIMRHLELTMQL